MQQTRRAKVVNAIRDQLELLRNPSYKKTTVKRVKGGKATEKQVAVQPWWKRTSTGGYAVTCRIGGKLFDFQPGSNAIIVPGNGQEAMKAVADVLRALETAVMNGKLDQHMVSKPTLHALDGARSHASGRGGLRDAQALGEALDHSSLKVS
jgi:hypothetical protein